MKGLAWLLAACILLLPLSTCASEELDINARGAVLIDGASGRVLFARNADDMLPMASTTKIMTALLALENAELGDAVTASTNASGVPGTSIYLSVGEVLTMEQMLYGLMLRSGNDAAVAIAEHVAGDLPAFSEMMNARAAELGADAHFENPHGLDAAGHAASARALALILREALQIEDFRAISSTQRMVIPWDGNRFSRVLVNKNRLLSGYDGATAGKTGFTTRAGRCLVFSAQRGELQLIGAVLNCPAWFDDSARMLDYGFEHYHLATALEEGQVACDTAVARGLDGTVAAVAAGTLSAAVGNSERWTVRYDFGEGVAAPVSRGQIIGTASIRVGGEEIASTPLVAARDVEERTLLKALRRVLRRWALGFQ